MEYGYGVMVIEAHLLKGARFTVRKRQETISLNLQYRVTEIDAHAGMGLRTWYK